MLLNVTIRHETESYVFTELALAGLPGRRPVTPKAGYSPRLPLLEALDLSVTPRA